MAGEHLPPFLSPRSWEATLRGALTPTDPSAALIPFKVVRAEGARAIVMVDRLVLAQARAAWNRHGQDAPVSLTTRRTWGTLVGAKRWLRS